MRAQRDTTPSPDLPSSPPPASPQEGDRDRCREGYGQSSPAATLYTAPSPTQTLGHSSPELPPLPSLPTLGGSTRTPSTVAGHQATDSTYHTASWGSPYQHPPPGLGGQLGAHKHTWTLSSDDLEEDSPSHFFGLSHLLPSRLHINDSLTTTRPSTPSFAAALARVTRPLTDSTSRPGHELRRHHTEPAEGWSYHSSDYKEWGSERGHWWSDESVKSAPESPGTPRKVRHRELADKSDQTGELVEDQPWGSPRKGSGFTTHWSRKSNLTLKPEDFWAVFPKDRHSMSNGMLASEHAEPPQKHAEHEMEKALITTASTPTPEDSLPLIPPGSEEAAAAAAAATEHVHQGSSESSSASARKSTSTSAAPRTRKRLLHRNKACWVSLPLDVRRTASGEVVIPLSPSEVEARLKEFERAGFDTRGFDHWCGASADNRGQSQSRPIFPDPEQLHVESKTRNYTVRIVDKREWEAYVSLLTEQKLRALGVDLGEEGPTPSMSRRASAQYPPLPFSPPPLTASANSQRKASNGSIISPPFVPGISNHASTRSTASPLSSVGHPRGNLHMHRHSAFTSPSMFPQMQSTSHGVSAWSPQQYLNQSGGPRGGSPALPNRPELLDLISPVSPFSYQQNQKFPFSQKDEVLVQMQRHQQQLQAQLLQQQQQQQIGTRPSPTLAEVPEDENEDGPVSELKTTRGTAGPELAVPTPRGHRHNISVNLERGVQTADYHLEEAIDKQFDEDDGFTAQSQLKDPGLEQSRNFAVQMAPSASREKAVSGPNGVPCSQPHNGTQPSTSLQRQSGVSSSEPDVSLMQDGWDKYRGVELSDIETNPSIEGEVAGHVEDQHQKTPHAAPRAGPPSNGIGNGYGPSVATHASKASVSTLNVEAKEFKFNPGASFKSNNFTSSGFTFQPMSTKALMSSVPKQADAATHGSKTPLDGLPGGLNVAAPSFMPRGALGLPLPSQEFSFVTEGPVFTPDVPAFKPSSGHPARLDVNSDSKDKPTAAPNRIFTNVDLNQVVKPSKKSKAVPIVRPKSSHAENDDEVEDEWGRLAQADGRQKRARRAGADGDEVPRFAVPSHPPVETDQVQAMPIAKEDKSLEQQGEEAIDVALGQAGDTGGSVHNCPSPTAASGSITSDALNLPAEASEFKTDTDDEASTLPDGTSDGGELRSGQSEINPSMPRRPDEVDRGETSSAPEQKTLKPSHIKHTSRGSLSAAAQTFVFRPGTRSGSGFGFHVTQPSLDHETGFEDNQVAESPNSPPYPSRSPATTFRPSDDGSYKTALEGRRHVPYPDSEGVDYDASMQPSFNEIDAVIKHLDEEGSDFGVEREEPSWAQSGSRPNSLDGLPHTVLRSNPHARSDAPSPSPRRKYVPMPDGLHAESSSVTHDPFSDGRAGIAYESLANRMNRPDDVPISDWDDIVSSTGGKEAQMRSESFDNNVDNIIDSALQTRLDPLEKSLQGIQLAIAAMSYRDSGKKSRRSTSAGALDSDADDEDDDVMADLHYRNRSPRRDRQVEKIRSLITEAVSHQQTQRQPTLPAISPTEFHQALADVKTSVARSASANLHLDDIREVVEEAVAHKILAIVQSQEQPSLQESAARLSELEKTVMEVNARVVEEAEARKTAERREADAQKLLKLAEEEIALFKESTDEDGQKLRALDEKYHVLKLQIAASDEAQKYLRDTLSSLTAENAALQSTLEEYRVSSAKWREEVDQASANKEKLRNGIEALMLRTEEAVRIRETMRTKLNKLQTDMSTAAGQMAAEQVRWQRSDEEQRKQYEVLAARMAAEARMREKLELELERLETQEREGIKLRLVLEETQAANSELRETVNKLRLESLEYQRSAERYEREFREAREVGRAEVQRTRMLMEADIEAANNQVNIVRADLESEVARVRAELENVRMDADTAKAKHELLLEEEADAKRDALRKALETNNAALQEQRQNYEHRIEELQQQHARALNNAVEDKQRSETHLNERLSLADAKLDLLQDKVLHLEEKLEVAKSAAHAAAIAAQTAKSPGHTALSVHEKLSPQALRESIVVLQEQLQERETRIEQLEHQISEFDTEAPAKLKERDTEIGWLRELLGVRVDDIADLVNALSQPAFDREAVRDAAIRIRTNLQMEQQEKERLISGGGNFPTLASLSNFASPKAVQLAAALGNWRKGKEMITSNLSQSTPVSRDQTPSKSASTAQSFLSGLMTPPTSNLRRSSQASTPQGSRVPSRGLNRGAAEMSLLSSRQREKQPVSVQPSTPPLLRETSYDQDADDGDYNTNGFYDDDQSTMDGNPTETPRFEPFGPAMHD